MLNRVKRCSRDTDKGLRNAMNIRMKKLVGTTIFVVGSACYFFFAITVAIARLQDTTIGTQLLFYLLTTLIWLFFAGILVRWMQRPGPA
jgi:cation transporter-like permease